MLSTYLPNIDGCTLLFLFSVIGWWGFVWFSLVLYWINKKAEDQ